MTLRPRFAGEGILDRPAWVTVARSSGPDREVGDVIGQHWGGGRDPFQRGEDGLLLAESFARAELFRPRKAQAWYSANGVVDVAAMFPEDAAYWEGEPVEDDWFRDAADEVLGHQRNVRWHLEALARLSAHREAAQPPHPTWRPHEGWRPSWSSVVLGGPREVLWVGASSDFEAHITEPMQRYARWDEVPDRGSLTEWNTGRWTNRQMTDEWWPVAHRTWRLLSDAQVPVVWVPTRSWYEEWADYEVDGIAPHGRRGAGRLSMDWHGLLELERRLIAPFVERAARREVGLWRETTRVGEGITWEQRITVMERRRWDSILAPIYLQLLEALRRVSEGHSGATWCRECGEPFLTLDARRSSFCDDRHRLRFGQRERRKRLAVAVSSGSEA